MDQAIYNNILSNIRDMEKKLGARSHFVPGDPTHTTYPRKQ